MNGSDTLLNKTKVFILYVSLQISQRIKNQKHIHTFPAMVIKCTNKSTCQQAHSNMHIRKIDQLEQLRAWTHMDVANEETKDKDSNVKFEIRVHLACRRRGEGAAGPGLLFFNNMPLLLTEKTHQWGKVSISNTWYQTGLLLLKSFLRASFSFKVFQIFFSFKSLYTVAGIL